MPSVRAGLRGLATAVLTLSWALFTPGCGGDGRGTGVVDPDEQDIAASDAVVFADPGLELAVRAALGQPEGAVTAVAAHNLRNLDASGRDITDLEGIGQLDSLKSLDLGDNGIADVEPLAPLTVLQYLDLADNEIVDLSPLAAPAGLKVLILDRNRVVDLSPILGLETLERLELSDAHPADGVLAALQSRGVEVVWRASGSGDGGQEQVDPHQVHLVFASNRSGDYDAYIVDEAGATVNLTVDPADELGPSFSPDGRRVAFHTDRDGNWEIYILAADGSGLTNVTEHQASDRSAAWSPDGTRLAFVSGRDGSDDIFVMDVDVGVAVNHTEGRARDATPVWSPGGDWIAFSTDRDGDYEIALLSVRDGTIRQVTDNLIRDEFPTWSPDGNRISYASSDGDGSTHIRVLDLRTGVATQVTDGPQTDTHPSWAPDGGTIAFLSNREGSAPLDLAVYSMTPTGEQVTLLAGNQGETCLNPSWAIEPDAAFLVGAETSGTWFADPWLESAVRSELGVSGSAELTDEELVSVTKLVARNRAIVNLAGIERLTRLKYLILDNGVEVDARASPDSAAFEFLRHGNQVRDLSPLAQLAELEELGLSWNPLVDLTPLANLVRLEKLRVGGGDVVDLTPLAGLVELKQLSITYTGVADLSPISELKQLNYLVLAHNSIADVAPLQSLSGLWFLSLIANRVSDVSPLLSLTDLRTLRLYDNPLDEVSLGVHLPALEASGVGVQF